MKNFLCVFFYIIITGANLHAKNLNNTSDEIHNIVLNSPIRGRGICDIWYP